MMPIRITDLPVLSADADPEPVPEFHFDQSLSGDFDD